MKRLTRSWMGLAAILALLMCGCAGDDDSRPPMTDTAHLAAVSVGPTQGDQLLGDMDNSGTAGVSDAIAVLRIVVGLAPDTPWADLDQDGAAGVSDAIKILRIVVGLDTAWPLPWQLAWVRGSILDRFTEAGVAGLSVTIGGKLGVTDANGAFCVKGVPIGDSAIGVDLTGTGSGLVWPLPDSLAVVAPETAVAAIHTASVDRLPPASPSW